MIGKLGPPCCVLIWLTTCTLLARAADAPPAGNSRAAVVEPVEKPLPKTAVGAPANPIWVFAVAVDRYDRIPNLAFCGNDATAAADVFRKRFQVAENRVVLIHDRATNDRLPHKANIERALREFTSDPNRLGKQDLLVFLFSGHGVAIKERSYLCPREADIRRPEETMIPMDWVYKQLFRAPAGQKLLIIDACRNEVDPDKVQTRSLNPANVAAAQELETATRGFRSLVKPPADQSIILFRSCGEEQTSIEDPVAEQGLFMRYVLQGLKGDDAKLDQGIAASRLFAYAARLTKDDAAKRFSRVQVPSMLITGDVVLPLPGVVPGEHNDYANSIGMAFSLVRPGLFLMGAPHSDPDAAEEELPQHRVRLTRPFLLGRYEVTQRQYRAVMGGGERQDDAIRPMDNVSWDDAVEFCNRLSQLERLTPYYEFADRGAKILGGAGYRLPSEAEWEYAARSGQATRWHFGDHAAMADRYCWHAGNSDGTLHNVGSKEGNSFGLFDMHGNVWEWCFDPFRRYSEGEQTDPQGPPGGGLRVVRGGAFSESATAARASNRMGYGRSIRTAGIGFRVARWLDRTLEE